MIENKPILLTGAHRTGTTWLANMLALSKGMQIASEPFNLMGWAYKLDGLVDNWFTYVPALPEEKVINAYRKVMDCKTGRIYGRKKIQRYFPFTRKGRLIIKDPIACMSSDWLANKFELDVLVTIRHPAAFALSLKRMNWSFDFNHLLRQEKLVDDYLSLFIKEMEAQPSEVVEQAALVWKIIYHVLSQYIYKNPEWIMVKHEDISRKPIEELRVLYDRLGLIWSNKIEMQVKQYTGKGNPVNPKQGVAHQMVRDSKKNIDRWKKLLSKDEVYTVKRVTAGVAEKYYCEADW